MASATTRRARKDRTGREQRRRSATAQSRRPNLTRYYGRTLPAVTPGEFEFELTLLRGRGAESLSLDSATTSFEWVDAESMMTGNLQLQRPDVSDAKSLPIARGHRVRCRVKWAGKWYELWTMRCADPQPTVETGEVSVDLKDDMALVRVGKRRFLYRRSKRRRHGWFGHEILRDAARKERVRLGAVAKCRKRLNKIDVTGSFLDLVVKVYEEEHKATGRKFVVRMRNGRLEVVSYKRNRQIYVLADQIRSAAVAAESKVQNPVTVLRAHGRVGSGRGAKTVRYTASRPEMVRRFGRVEKKKSYGKVDSFADLKRQVLEDLAKEYEVKRVFTVSAQGVPFIRRGDGVQLVLPSEGLRGEDSFVYCTTGSHQVQGGSYTATWDFEVDDPFEKDRLEREKAAREKAAKRRKARRR